jgi:hypothetical protein
MFWITKYKHNKITEAYQRQIDDLREALNRKESFEKIMDKVVDKTNSLTVDFASCVGTADLMMHLDDSVPRYVEDYFGGKVIKQEATKVTILDENGKATYALTKKPADKGKKFLLVREDDEF